MSKTEEILYVLLQYLIIGLKRKKYIYLNLSRRNAQLQVSNLVHALQEQCKWI